MRRTMLLCGVLATVAVADAGPAVAQQPPSDAANAKAAHPVPASVRVVRDVEYARYGERAVRLDLYLPPASSGRPPWPGVLVVRGGGWRLTDKEGFGFIAGRLASEGFVAASIEYRSSDEAKFPAAVHDVKAAVRWLRAHAAEYGVDPDAIGAIGGSAGGHLVTLLAASADAPGLEGEGGHPGTSSRVQAAVAMGCPCTLTTYEGKSLGGFVGEPIEAHRDAVRAASPATYVDASAAPLLLLHSPSDSIVPYQQSVDIAAAYQRAGAVVTLTPVDAPGAHFLWYEARYFPQVMDQAVAFLRAHLLRR